MCHYQHGDITSPGPGSEAAPKGAAGGCPGVLGAIWGVAILASGPLSVLPAFFLWDEVGVTAELWKNVTASMLLLRALLAPGHCLALSWKELPWADGRKPSGLPTGLGVKIPFF